MVSDMIGLIHGINNVICYINLVKLEDYKFGLPLICRLPDIDKVGPGCINPLSDIYLTPHLLYELGTFEKIILIKILPYMYDGIGLDMILI